MEGLLMHLESAERVQEFAACWNEGPVRYELDKAQLEDGRYFLHGHPRSATSWKERGVTHLAGMKGVMEIHADMCRFWGAAKR